MCDVIAVITFRTFTNVWQTNENKALPVLATRWRQSSTFVFLTATCDTQLVLHGYTGYTGTDWATALLILEQGRQMGWLYWDRT